MLDSSVFTLLVRLVVSLGIVIGLMLVLSGALRKRGIVIGGANGTGRARQARSVAMLDIVARKPLGRNAQLAIVRAGNKTLVLGITEHQITMLTETDPTWDDSLDGDIDINIDSNFDSNINATETQRTGFPRSGTTGTFPTWKTMLEGVRDRTVRR